MTSLTGPSLLDAIVGATRQVVGVRMAARPQSALERAITRRPDHAAFERAIRSAKAPRIIAECKRRSPSRGILRQIYAPASHARAYAGAGAAAISVLTEPTFFDGSLGHLEQVRAAVDLPLLRKDFIVSEYQLFEAAAAGADAVLLIVAALTASELRHLLRRAGEVGLAALVEVHDLAEIPRAVDAGARLIGVNSRDLRTLAVDAAVLERAAARLPAGAARIAESGIRERGDLDRLAAMGYDAFLVGERLIAQQDPGAALRDLCSA
jgi:indole-3-glycerol phosphate synthase